MKRLARIALMATVLLAICANIGIVSAENSKILTKHSNDTLVQTKLRDELDAYSAAQKAGWLQALLLRTTIGDPSIGEPDKKGAIPVMVPVTYPSLASGVDPKTVFDGKDPAGFVGAALKNADDQMKTFEVKAKVTFKEGADPVIQWDSAKGVAGLKKALAAQAKAAAASFASKPMLAAMSSFVLTHPARIVKLDITGGPHAMKLSATAPDFERMHRSALWSALTRVAYEAQGPKTESSELTRLFNEQIAAYGTKFQKAKKAATDKAVVLTFDPWLLMEKSSDRANKEITDYRDTYSTSHSEFALALTFLTTQLPDLPALEMPKSGRLQGGERGTQIIMRAKKGDGNCMVRFLKGDEVKALCFIRDGEKATIHLPSGRYTLQLGYGSIWYGDDGLFGPDDIGSYSSDEVQIKGSNYYHTYTFSRVDKGSKGAMDELSRDDFMQ